jgi:hypothetical protein
MRARCFSYRKGGKRKGAVVGRGGGVEATHGLCAAHLSLVRRKDKATHVGLGRAMF